MRSNIVAFPKQHRLPDPLDRQNLEHAYVAMHVAAQYDADRIDGFIKELIEGDRAGDIADLLKNNARAIRYLMSAIDFLMTADNAISKAADRYLSAAQADGGVHALSSCRDWRHRDGVGVGSQ